MMLELGLDGLCPTSLLRELHVHLLYMSDIHHCTAHAHQHRSMKQQIGIFVFAPEGNHSEVHKRQNYKTERKN